MLNAIDNVLPVEDHELLERANPIKSDKIEFDRSAVEAPRKM